MGALSALLLSLPLIAAPAVAAPSVVVTIVPLHSLVAAITEGVAEPILLLRGNVSPHDYSMRPADMRALSGADLVVWAGPELETFLARPLASLPQGVRTTALLHDAGLRLLSLRRGGLWEDDRHDHGDDHGHNHDHHNGGHDPHIWLSPENARRIAGHIAAALAGIDPINANRYAANRDRLAARIDALDRRLAARLAPLAGLPYIVFHDAYHYFEDHYGLTPAGAVTVDPSRPPGARRVREIRDRILASGTLCLFSEPQFQPAIVSTLIAGTTTGTGILDPMGATLEPGEDAWFQLMEAMADALTACLTE